VAHTPREQVGCASAPPSSCSPSRSRWDALPAPLRGGVAPYRPPTRTRRVATAVRREVQPWCHTAGWNEVRAGSVGTHRALSVTQRALSVTQRALSVTQRALSVTQRALSVTQRALSVTQRALRVTQRALSVTQRALGVTQRALSVTQQALNVNQRALSDTQRALGVAPDSVRIVPLANPEPVSGGNQQAAATPPPPVRRPRGDLAARSAALFERMAWEAGEVRLCRYRFSPTGELGYRGTVGYGRVR
jgi:hypothetical protein